MRNSILIGKLFGIRIGLHPWVPWLGLAITIFAGAGNPALMGIITLFIVAVFSLVLLHELGHSLTARYFGIKVSEITLWPLGGVAWMEEIPEDSKIEGLIAIAGPAVNLGLALLAAPLLFVPGAAGLAMVFIQINLMLGIFNLVPAFPMDGGRVLRALLARKNDWLTATEKAVRIGRVIAILGGILGLFTGRIMIPIVAFYIVAMGQRELFAIRARKLGRGFPFGAFADAARRAQAKHSNSNASPIGFEASADFETAKNFEWAAGHTKAPHARVPGEHQEQGSSGKGFSDEEIEKLESLRGRMGQDWRDQDAR